MANPLRRGHYRQGVVDAAYDRPPNAASRPPILYTIDHRIRIGNKRTAHIHTTIHSFQIIHIMSS
eukprot:scaffold69979_cov69-Attheya_sp.AAC.2